MKHMNESTRKNSVELLERDSKIFRKLHNVAGFNFEEEFEIVKIDGNFTFNSMRKALNISSDDMDKYNIALIFTNIKYKENYNYIIPVYSSGFGLKFDRKPGYDYNLSIDNFWRKSDIDSARKDKNNIAYIVCQLNVSKIFRKKVELDESERYTYLYKIGLSDRSGTRHGISRIQLEDRKTGKQLEYKPLDGFLSEDVNRFVDKSGYIVEGRYTELKRKAESLRRERARAEAEKTDFTNLYNELKKACAEAKNRIAAFLEVAENVEDYSKLKSMVFDMQWTLSDLHRFESRYTNNSFISVEQAKNSYDSILEKFEKIHA